MAIPREEQKMTPQMLAILEELGRSQKAYDEYGLAGRKDLQDNAHRYADQLRGQAGDMGMDLSLVNAPTNQWGQDFKGFFNGPSPAGKYDPAQTGLALRSPNPSTSFMPRMGREDPIGQTSMPGTDADLQAWIATREPSSTPVPNPLAKKDDSFAFGPYGGPPDMGLDKLPANRIPSQPKPMPFDRPTSTPPTMGIPRAQPPSPQNSMLRDMGPSSFDNFVNEQTTPLAMGQEEMLGRTQMLQAKNSGQQPTIDDRILLLMLKANGLIR